MLKLELDLQDRATIVFEVKPGKTAVSITVRDAKGDSLAFGYVNSEAIRQFGKSLS